MPAWAVSQRWMKAEVEHPSTVLAATLQRVADRDQTSDVSVYASATHHLSPHYNQGGNQEDADGDKSDFFSKIQVHHEYSIVKNMGPN